MRDAFATRSPYSLWRPEVLDDYCRHGLLPADDGDGFVLACPPIVAPCFYGIDMSRVSELFAPKFLGDKLTLTPEIEIEMARAIGAERLYPCA